MGRIRSKAFVYGEVVSGFWDMRILPFLVEKACRSRTILEERRRAIPRAANHVLEVGVGSGLNLAFYDPARVTDVVGVDPSAPLLDRATLRARAARLPVELVRGSAEELPFDAGRFDDVVLTYTLCSVAHPARALAEMRRVLKPGGRLIFVEHGLAPDARPRRWQKRITPSWRRLSGNCHLDRDVASELEASGFAVLEMNAAYTGAPRWLTFTYEGIASPR
jgi:ubiquinone/menaquinone biosynthesis C-methylase UbiE